MKEDDILLRVITDETKNSIENLDVVTPTVYEAIFSKHAAENNAPYKDDDKDDSVNHILEEQISKFEDMQTEASENAKKLSDNTDRAITAIKEKDDNILAEVLEETQELRKKIEELKESVYKDELTRAFNRKWLHDNFLDEDEKSLKNSGTLAIIDLNYFKEVNDTYGHTIGDKVLIFIASQLKKTKENVVRYGGDEFIVIFNSKAKQKTALSILNSIRDDVLTKNMKIKEKLFKVSFSFGAQEFKKGDNLNQIIEKADKKMYKDKKEIKKRVTSI